MGKASAICFGRVIWFERDYRARGGEDRSRRSLPPRGVSAGQNKPSPKKRSAFPTVGSEGVPTGMAVAHEHAQRLAQNGPPFDQTERAPIVALSPIVTEHQILF